MTRVLVALLVCLVLAPGGRAADAPAFVGLGTDTWSDGDFTCTGDSVEVVITSGVGTGVWTLTFVEGPVSSDGDPSCNQPIFDAALVTGSPATGFTGTTTLDGCAVTTGPLGPATAFSVVCDAYTITGTVAF